MSLFIQSTEDSASQTFLCHAPVTSSAEIVRRFVIKFYFETFEVDVAYVHHLHFRRIVEAY